MRLALLDTPEGRAMINSGDTRLYWMNESDTYMPMSPFINTTASDAVARLWYAARLGLDMARANGLTKTAETIMEAMNAVECPCKGSDEMCPCQNRRHAPDAVGEQIGENDD